VQYGTINSDVSSPFGVGTISGSGAGLGASLTWYARSGFYLDAQAQAIWYDSTLGSTTASRTLIGGNHALGYALSLEGGQRIALNTNWSITPQAQLSYSAIDANGFTDSFGAAVSPDLAQSLKGRLGLSADFDQGGEDADGTKSHTHTYGIANLYYDFGGATKTSVAGVAFANQADPLWGGVGLGGTYSWANDKYAVHGEASVNTSLDHFGQSYGLGATGGFTVKW
jgi:fibronectin-binding autotransporter adhesin